MEDPCNQGMCILQVPSLQCGVRSLDDVISRSHGRTLRLRTFKLSDCSQRRLTSSANYFTLM